ncbi:hypothetical protein EJ08DRAFT_696837 [Tothia fuscella]|uniref:PLAT domain-containing protein n=1 Tax=Tothia fuscella TaxID=1048955 RepID=A0A9P4NTD4_9PEZI|nr:hypothetical protein EJ08DRAFT_696837 [Tothia fuscella]
MSSMPRRVGLGNNFQNIIHRPLIALPDTAPEKSTFSLSLPYDQLSVLARKYENSEVLRGLPVYAIAELGPLSTASYYVDEPAHDNGDEDDDGEDDGLPKKTIPKIQRDHTDQPIAHLRSKSKERRVEARKQKVMAAIKPKPKLNIPLGMLHTDHAGYCSFDLGMLRSDEVVAALYREKLVRPQSSINSAALRADGRLFEIISRGKPFVGFTHLWVMPFGDPTLIKDALLSADVGPNFMTLRIELDEARIGDRMVSNGIAMPSMQNPNILDYRISPGSFSMPSAVILGEDGCQSFLPSNLASQSFRFFQVARSPGPQLEANNYINPFDDDERLTIRDVSGFRLGYIFDYTTEWFPIGHSLGNLSYSLPLAPCEMVKISIVDWSRGDTAAQDEATGFSESLAHQQVCDRSLGESVDAMLNEWQKGSSFMGGIAASGAYSGGSYAVGGATSLGGATTSSKGSRNLTAETSQKVADAFSQATTAMRELCSTVVVQRAEQESAKATTRIVANYNHGHAMTVLYYEVLRHYRVVTQLAKTRLALLCDYRLLKTDWDNEMEVYKLRRELTKLLLDPSLAGSFDALNTLAQAKSKLSVAEKVYEASAAPGDVEFVKYRIQFWTGDVLYAGTNANPYLEGMAKRIHSTSTALAKMQFERNHSDDVFELKPRDKFKWSDFKSFKVHLYDAGAGPEWFIEKIKLEGFTREGRAEPLFEDTYHTRLQPGTATVEFMVKQPAPKPGQPVLDNFIDPVTQHNVDILKDHFRTNEYYYNRQLWLAEDANARDARWEDRKIKGIDSPILDLIENKAIEINGNYVAFPVPMGNSEGDPEEVLKKAFQWSEEQSTILNPTDSYVEQLLALPTRGVFAEAKLGQCNSNEKIDNTRFWDWQTSPIPYQAPDIAPASTDSKHAAAEGFTPTALPQSVVNIVSPQSLPDPTGLKAAMDVLGKPDIFRNMSGIEQLGSLLEKLSDNATAMAQSGMANNKSPNTLKSIRESPELTKEQKQKLINDTLANEVAAGKPQDKDKDKDGGASGGPNSGSGGTSTGGGGSTGGGKTGGGNMEEPKQDAPKKPTQPDPLPDHGLVFQIRVHGPDGEPELLMPRAGVTIIPNGEGTRPDDSTYVPGKGAPKTNESRKPRTWKDVSAEIGAILLHSENIVGPGQILIDLQSVKPSKDWEDARKRAYRYSDMGNPLRTPVFDPGFFWSHDTFSYEVPEKGNRVLLDVKPEKSSPISVTLTSEKSVENTFGGGVEAGLSKGVGSFGFSFSHEQKTNDGKTAEVTMTYQTMTGGLEISQIK